MDSKYKHKKIYIKESHIDGTGIFAKVNIKKNETIALIKGKIINWIIKDLKSSAVGPNWIGIGKNKWIDPAPPFNSINHSCNPNAGIKGSKTVVALKNIKKDEEILIDYSITEEDTLWELHQKCRCNNKNCRKNIKSIQSLPKETFKSYLPNISKYFQKIYMKHHNGK